MSAIRTRALSRYYGQRRTDRGTGPVAALDHFDLDVEPGQVRGLLGPNGAGKTTLCRILSTVLLPASGTAEVLGHDVVSAAATVRRVVGVVFGGERGLYNRLTPRQNLQFWGALYGLHGRRLRNRTDALLERTGLTQRADTRVDFLSRGMKQRLHLARGLVPDPPVLIFDEPTVGMDPVAAHDFRALVAELRAEQRTILLTTHDMAEAEALCDQVTLVDRGRILATESPERIGALIGAEERIEADDVPEAAGSAIARVAGVLGTTGPAPGRLVVRTSGPDATREVLALLVRSGVTRLVTGPPRLEEVYLRLIGSRGMAVEA
ncbi:ABC transporter ATP-binding protein [Amycolatopsis sp. PS_44_ISF1]|uniref:ABC transporter ATP-binding protein n=1 Tax=Amycolatopsis sp. PS_44_ISF1 TaxID=2974917 RepID=UPI0028E06036|nr:ABC transporter ATP-binding protein [Amycolatopsis sp. PS_44_ISF1]MDT8912745.1 ABC transporter ATP-binding protein [Amycolatopsis sp. PS_44_ISF1]